MEKRYQIFISSTYKDLIEERQKVTKVILKLYHFPIGMEMFHADNEEQWAQIKNTIDMSDYFVLIVGRCCGTLIENEGISYTEKEYDYAFSKGIPILRFVISDEAKKESYGNETIKQQRALRKFRKKVEKSQCDFWRTPDELASMVSTAISMKTKEINRDGWIRYNSDNIFCLLDSDFASFNTDQIDALYRKVMYAKLLDSKDEVSDRATVANNFIENQLMLLNSKHASMEFYIKNLTRNITINLYDEFIEIVSLVQYVFSGIPNKDSFCFFPWLFPGTEQNSYDFISVKYNAVTNPDYIKRGTFKPTPNEAYVSGGIGIVIPYDMEKTEHNITFKSTYHTDYATFFHSYSFNRICEHFNLSANLCDYRTDAKDTYVLKWEMFTPNPAYDFNSKNKIYQTDKEIKFSPVKWMTPGCGYIITINHVSGVPDANSVIDYI